MAAVRKALPKDNWVMVTTTPPSFVEQIRIHANATMLVFIHGSGAGNAVWMRPKAVFIEIQIRGCASFFMHIAQAVGLKVFETLSPQTNRVAIVVNITFMLGIIERGYGWLLQNRL
jgi:capsular polysaccharide biosynthesis protein